MQIHILLLTKSLVSYIILTLAFLLNIYKASFNVNINYIIICCLKFFQNIELPSIFHHSPKSKIHIWVYIHTKVTRTIYITLQ